MKELYITKSDLETQKLGRELAKIILKAKSRKGAFVIGLEGDLGGGKTTFLQGFAGGLGIKEKILSPTFVIMKKFAVKSRNYKWFYHIDCYRIQKPEELLDIGLNEVISSPENIVAIEWSERVKSVLPENILKIKFDFIDDKKREIKIFPRHD